MKKILLLAVIGMFLGSASEASAQNRNRRNDGFNDRDRIRQGVRTGRLTRDEARELRNDERELRRDRRETRRDGITREERREIRRDEREQDREIREELRDDDRNNRRRVRGYNNRRGNGYYRRGAGSRNHPRFGRRY